MTSRPAVVALILALTAAILFGGLLHTFVPHSHGEHSKSEASSAAWDSLHGSLRHEDKRALGLAALIQALLALSAVFAFGLMRSSPLPAVRLAAMRAPAPPVHPLAVALRRGIEAHRAFR